MSLDLSRKQLELIADALDLYSRLLCVQLEEIIRLASHGYLRTSGGTIVDLGALDHLTASIYEAKEALGFSPTSSHGIHSMYVIEDAREALALCRAIRRSL